MPVAGRRSTYERRIPEGCYTTDDRVLHFHISATGTRATPLLSSSTTLIEGRRSYLSHRDDRSNYMQRGHQGKYQHRLRVKTQLHGRYTTSVGSQRLSTAQGRRQQLCRYAKAAGIDEGGQPFRCEDLEGQNEAYLNSKAAQN
jgi:hypothetical protein